MTTWEMLDSTNQMQGENEQQWKKVNENTYDISSIKSVTKGLFTRREEDPRRWNNFTLGLNAEISARDLSN